MSTSFLYHVCSVQGVKHKATHFKGGEVIFEVEPKPELFVCSKCTSRNVVRNGGKERYIRSIKMGMKTSYIRIFCPRLRCKDCGLSRFMSLPFAGRWKPYTNALARQAWELSKAMTLKDVSNYLQMDWRTVKEIQKKRLKSKYGKPSLKGLKNIGVDEICIGKGHRYMTVVIDLDSGRVVFMSKGKEASSLLPFWKKLRRAKVKLDAVAMDMGPAYISAVQEHHPNATIVFDHFHVRKLFNEKLSTFRRDLYPALPDNEQKKVLKGSRWLLLKNSENLDESKSENDRLQKALDLNEPLSIVYYMKEDLRQVWYQESKEQAEVKLKEWANKAASSGINMLKKFSHRLLGCRTAILAYYDNRLSTGPVEAFNNKIKTIQRQAYGYRDQEFYRLKVYASHESRYELVG